MQSFRSQKRITTETQRLKCSKPSTHWDTVSCAARPIDTHFDLRRMFGQVFMKVRVKRTRFTAILWMGISNSQRQAQFIRSVHASKGEQRALEYHRPKRLRRNACLANNLAVGG